MSPLQRLSFVVAVLVGAPIVGCKKKEEPPPDPALRDKPSFCFLTEVAAAQNGEFAAKFSFKGNEFGNQVAKPLGPARVEVRHEDANSDGTKSTPAVCTMTGTITAASYDPSGVATMHGKFDKPCPRPVGKVAKVIGWFRQTVPQDFMGYDLNCIHTTAVPSALGGGGKDADQQRFALNRTEAKKAAPAEFAMLDAYLDSLVRVAKAVEKAPAAPSETTCKTASGSAPLFRSQALVETLAEYPDAPALPAPDQYQTMSYDSEFVKAMGHAYGATTADTIRLAKLVAAQGPYVVVRRATSQVDPTTSMGGTHSGTFTPGRWAGNLYVVNRLSGAVECAAPFQSSVTSTKFTQNTRMGDSNVQAQLLQEFVLAIEGEAHTTLRRIAPRVTLAP
jgi:hypothetical protein